MGANQSSDSSSPSSQVPVAAKDAKPCPQVITKDDGSKLKICCACPETREPRDQCVIMKGEENCTAEIEAHKQCLRKLGFNI